MQITSGIQIWALQRAHGKNTHTHFSTCSVVPHGKNTHTLQDMLSCTPQKEHTHISGHARLYPTGRAYTHFRTCSVVAHGKDIYTLQDMLGGAAVSISS